MYRSSRPFAHSIYKICEHIWSWSASKLQKSECAATAQVSQYLESYLWPNFDPETSTPAHVLSIAGADLISSPDMLPRAAFKKVCAMQH